MPCPYCKTFHVQHSQRWSWRPLLSVFVSNMKNHNCKLLIPDVAIVFLKTRLPPEIVGLVQIHFAELRDDAFMLDMKNDIARVYHHLIHVCPCMRRNAMFKFLGTFVDMPLLRLNLERNWPKMSKVLDEKMDEMVEVIPIYNGRYKVSMVTILKKSWRECREKAVMEIVTK